MDVETTSIEQIISPALEPRQGYRKSFAFSVHKAGSSLMHNLLTDYCRFTEFPVINIPDSLFRAGIFEAEWEKSTEVCESMADGYLYVGFRSLPYILNPERKNKRENRIARFVRFLLAPEHQNTDINPRKYRSCLLVRDPRDCLVSQYYSMGRSKQSTHRLPDKNSQKFIETFCPPDNLDIDSYAVTYAPVLYSKLENYLSIVNRNSNIQIFRYEDIYFDKLKFLYDMLVWLEIPILQEPAVRAANLNDIRPEVENIGVHVRKGHPGDYAEKLTPATIEELNNKFSTLMGKYGYSL